MYEVPKELYNNATRGSTILKIEKVNNAIQTEL